MWVASQGTGELRLGGPCELISWLVLKPVPQTGRLSPTTRAQAGLELLATPPTTVSQVLGLQLYATRPSCVSYSISVVSSIAQVGLKCG